MPTTDCVLLAGDAAGRQIVSVHSKVTYRISPSGACRRADAQEPLLLPDAGEDSGAEPPRETDVTPVKTGTDFILLASAIAPRAGTREMLVRLGIARASWEYAVSGDRRCIYRGPNDVAFSEPEPFDTIPLRYERAYGGVDESVEDPPIKVVLDAFRMPAGVYPRNPVGRGYVVQDGPAIDGRPLPNVEHPRQRLTPGTLVARGAQNWWRQPIPWSCDWFDKTWYPRVTYFGALPEHLPDDDRQVAEVRMGLVEPRQNARHARLALENAIDSRFADAASPALVLPFLRGDETISLEGVSPHGPLVIRLPAERPRMIVRFEGRAHELTPVPHRILLSTEEWGMYIVWQGGWPTPRDLPDRLPREGDDPRMELEGVEAFCDGKRVQPLL
jgi:hypothetical protein